MNVPVCQEFECISRGSLLSFDFKGACSLVCELLFGSGKMEVGHVKPDLVVYLIVYGRSFLFVVLGFHL